MKAQAVSWNRLEVLLNEASVKKYSYTPTNRLKQDDPTHPHLLKCLRTKKYYKGASANSVPKKPATVNSLKENIGVEPTSTQSKTATDGVGTFASVPNPQKGSLEDLDRDSASCSDNTFEAEIENENNQEQVQEEEEEEVEVFVDQKKFRSVDDNEAGTTIARWAEWQSRQQTRYVQQPIIGQIMAIRRHRSVCGIEDTHIRELYRLKCQDLKIGSFTDSEDGFVQGTKKRASNNKLYFYESGFGPRALEKLGQIIENNAEIVQLFLRKSTLNGASVGPLAKRLAMMPCLMHLELANNAMEPQDFVLLLEGLTASNTLVSIDFSNYEPDKKNRFTAECLGAFRRFTQGNIYLQYVKLANLMLEDEAAQGILNTLEETPNLLSLDLSSNNCTGKCLENLPNLLARTTITRIDLSNNKLKKEGAIYLAKAIQTFKGANRDGLELIMENASLGTEMNMVFAAFGRENNVAKLNFSQNFLSNADIMRLENALSDSTKLIELNLSHCKLGEIGGRLIAFGIQKNKHLQNLILSDNDFGDAIGAQIIFALTHNTSVKTVDLSQNQLSSESAKALQAAIKKNTNIDRYNLSLNKFNEKEGYLLQEVLYFNTKIVQFNLHHNPVKYNTLEIIDKIVKDNMRKLTFHAVPRLRNEVEKRREYVEDEKHAIAETTELERVRSDVKRDVERFRETLTVLKNRSESPTVKKNEKLVVKLSKQLRNYAKEYSELVMITREFTDEAFLEKESYKTELATVDASIKQYMKKIEAKKKEIDSIKEKYDPEVRRLRMEISRLREENHFMEMYNDTISQKIKKEKKKVTIINQAHSPKISDIFLATSELARHKKKDVIVEKPGLESRSRIGGMEQSLVSHVSEDNKVVREYNFALKNQQLRLNKIIKENENKETIKKKKKPTRSEIPDQDDIKERINQKIKKLLKDIEGGSGTILAQIIDN